MSATDLNPLSIALVLILGLCFGSFLNVVIVRVPVMLMQRWRCEARAALELDDDTIAPMTLSRPRSLCPRCETAIVWHDNLPLIGWLKRRGRCASCAGRISVQYPLIELTGAVLACAVVALHGITFSALWLYAACMTLLALAIIDLRTQLLPDALTLPLLWAGLAYQLLFSPLMLPSAVIGAMLGYGVLWSFATLFRLISGRDGMGYGDFKLFAALGAWLGWQALPLVMAIAAGAGALCGLALQALVPRLRGQPLPFGPWLAIAGWLALLAGEGLMAGYLSLIGY